MTEHLTLIDEDLSTSKSGRLLKILSWLLYPTTLILFELHVQGHRLWSATLTFGVFLLFRQFLASPYYRHYRHLVWTPDQAPLFFTALVFSFRDIVDQQLINSVLPVGKAVLARTIHQS